MVSRRNPFDDLERLFERMGEQFEGEWGGGPSSMGGMGVSVDVEDRSDAFVVTADLPGYSKEDIDVQLRDGTLQISAERTTSTEEDEERGQGRYIRQERRAETASRSVTLPEAIAEDEVTAEYNNGVLTVTLPKVGGGADGGHRIEVE